MEFDSQNKIWAFSYCLSLASLIGIGILIEMDFGVSAILAFTAAFGTGYLLNNRLPFDR